MPDAKKSSIQLLARKTFSGSSRGGAILAEPSPVVSRAGLAGFLLDFESKDHHVSSLCAGFFKDLNPLPAMATLLEVNYADNKRDDAYSWTVDRQELPIGTELLEATGRCSIEGFNQLLGQSDGHFPVLMGFSLKAGDHHISTIRVRLYLDHQNCIQLGILFHDSRWFSPPFEFDYRVAYALVPAERVIGSGELAGNSEGGSASQLYIAVQPVLQGFELEFKQSDHHLDQIGVRLDSGRVRIWFNDRDRNDAFAWKVWWADVG